MKDDARIIGDIEDRLRRLESREEVASGGASIPWTDCPAGWFPVTSVVPVHSSNPAYAQPQYMVSDGIIYFKGAVLLTAFIADGGHLFMYCPWYPDRQANPVAEIPFNGMDLGIGLWYVQQAAVTPDYALIRPQVKGSLPPTNLSISGIFFIDQLSYPVLDLGAIP